MTEEVKNIVRSEAEELPSRALNTDSLTNRGPWSLLNAMAATRVEALVAEVSRDGEADFTPAMDRPTTLAVIHAALWAHGVRSDSFAGAMAYANLFDALGLQTWTFKSTPPEERLSSDRAREAQRSGATEHKAGGEQ